MAPRYSSHPSSLESKAASGQAPGLNPLAKEFVPVRPARAAGGANAGPHHQRPRGRRSNGQGGRGGEGKAGGTKAGGRRTPGTANGGPAAPHRANADSIRRTVYICDVDQQVTEAQLATVFLDSGPIVDCRVCGDPNSAMRASPSSSSTTRRAPGGRW